MKQVNEKLWIAPQMTDDDFAEAKAKGIVGVVNNRPDGEEPGQPTAEASAAKAAELGLDYVHIPVLSSRITEGQVRAFQRALEAEDGPVVAHCRSGTRSLTLFAIGEVLDGRMEVSELDALGTRLGVDLTGAKNWLKQNS